MSPSKFSLQHRTTLMAIAAAALTACGGGGGDAAPAGTPATPVYSQTMTLQAANTYAANEFLVNPSASWKPFVNVADGNIGGVAVVDLRALVPAGQVPGGKAFDLQTLGTYDAASISTTPQIKSDLIAVFVDSTGAMLPMVAGTTGFTLATSPIPCVTSSTDDPFAGDFHVPETTTRITVPAGATHLRLSVEDCHYHDNTTTAANPLRLSIKPVTP